MEFIDGVVTNLSPGDDARLQDHFWLRPEVLRFPENEIGECSYRDMTHDMTDSLCEGAARKGNQ